jgi:hypothetical protein
MRKGVKVRRVVRRFELWPVAKVALFFHLLCYLLTLGVLTGVWFLADRMGTVKNLERLILRLGWEEFEVHGDVLFRSAAIIGASLAVVATIATVTLAFFYNMLSGIVGGLVLSVLQEHTDGSSRSRRQRRKAAKARRKADDAEIKSENKARIKAANESRNKAGASAPPPNPTALAELAEAVPTPAARPNPAPAEPTRVEPVQVRQRVPVTQRPLSPSVLYPDPDDWEPDTVKSLFGDGDLDEDFATAMESDLGADPDADGGLWVEQSRR